MQITPKATGFALVVLGALALTGCVQQPPHVIPTSDPSIAPVFKSDAAALAAAKKAYTGYLAASDAVAHDGGTGTARLSKWETVSEYSRDVKSLSQMHAEGHHTTGTSSFNSSKLQSSTVRRDGKATVAVYFCLDISQTTLLDSKNENVGASRPLVLPLVVTFVSSNNNPKSLVIDRSDSWSGANFCA